MANHPRAGLHALVRPQLLHHIRVLDLHLRPGLAHLRDGFRGTARFEQGVRGLLPLLLADHLGIPSVDLSSTTSGGRGA